MEKSPHIVDQKTAGHNAGDKQPLANSKILFAKSRSFGNSDSMCIVAFAWKAHPRWKFIAIGNRDEFHARPAEPLARWEKPGHLLAGRDTTAGGTWLGVSEQGRFAVITNLSGHGAPDAMRASRGDLLKDYLTGNGRYAGLDTASFADFNPFNLITVENDEATIHSNRPDGSSKILQPGIHGLSNGTLAKPWPKSERLNAALRGWINADSDEPENLLADLADRAIFGSAENVTPAEPRHSPVFICTPQYGTRCSTVIAIDGSGAGLIIERRFAPSGQTTGETQLSFSWPS